jgi:hypothetical protein
MAGHAQADVAKLGIFFSSFLSIVERNSPVEFEQMAFAVLMSTSVALL